MMKISRLDTEDCWYIDHWHNNNRIMFAHGDLDRSCKKVKITDEAFIRELNTAMADAKFTMPATDEDGNLIGTCQVCDEEFVDIATHTCMG